MPHNIRKLTKNDHELFLKALHIFEEAFEMENFSPPSKEHLLSLLRREDFLVFAAVKGDEVVGAITAHVLPQYYAAKPLAYLYDLGVSPAHQRQGIGRALVETLNEYCRERGFEEVFVQADNEDQHALDFYRSTPITEEMACTQFGYKLNKA